MMTQLITSAMGLVKEEAKGRFDFGVSWVNDWAAHLNPLLLTRAFDVGFPWARPDCDNVFALDQSSQFRCQRFFFSDPLYEVITSLFVRNDSRIKTLRTEEIAGASLCRPVGYPTHELDQNGRNWVKDGKVTLIRPPTVDECFRLIDKSCRINPIGLRPGTRKSAAEGVRYLTIAAETKYHGLSSRRRYRRIVYGFRRSR